MGFAMVFALLLVVGAVFAVVAQRRSAAARSGRNRDGASDLDAEAEANHGVVRLGRSLSGVDVSVAARADDTAVKALMDAGERLRTAREQLAAARTAAEYAQVTQTAAEGLYHVRSARNALGLTPDPGLPDASLAFA